MLNIRGFKSSGTQALQISNDEDEDEYEDADEDDESDAIMDVTSSSDNEDEFDSVKPVGHKKPMLSAVEKEGPKTCSSVKATGDANYLNQSRFDQHNILPLTLKPIKSVRYEHMTVVQEEILPSILKRNDVLAKAKIGTDKTIAFLLPAIEVIVKSPLVL